MSSENEPARGPMHTLDDYRENVRRAARRAVLVQIAGQAYAAIAASPVDPREVVQALATIGKTLPQLVVDNSEKLLAEIESRYGADW